jgi:hypothetical protein
MDQAGGGGVAAGWEETADGASGGHGERRGGLSSGEGEGDQQE